MLSQARSNRKKTGGMLHDNSKKKRYQLGRETLHTLLANLKRKTIRVRGGNEKTRILGANVANVTDTSTGKTVQSKIVTVKENPADPNFVRRNIITKGAVIQTELGMARVTSRPGQDGALNAVLIAKK